MTSSGNIISPDPSGQHDYSQQATESHKLFYEYYGPFFNE